LLSSSNPYHIDNGIDSHLSVAGRETLGTWEITKVNVALPQDFGDCDSPGSDGRIWKRCMACHGDRGAYRTLAYNSPARDIGNLVAQVLPVTPFAAPSRSVLWNLKTSPWVRYKSSFSRAGNFKTKKSITFGSNPFNRNKKIHNPVLWEINEKIRNFRIPSSHWRFKDAGHIHIKK